MPCVSKKENRTSQRNETFKDEISYLKNSIWNVLVDDYHSRTIITQTNDVLLNSIQNGDWLKFTIYLYYLFSTAGFHY